MPLLVVVCVLAGLALLSVLTAYGFFVYSIKRRKPASRSKKSRDPNNPWVVMKEKLDTGKAWIRSQNPEEVEITSFDGLKLHGYFLPAKKPVGKAVLMMHGYRSYDFSDFACSARYFHEHGYDLLLPDQRCHGKSEGKYICFGIKERYDCRDWIFYLRDRLGERTPLYLMGVSMGCATVLMTLGFSLPQNVKGCIADCGFTSPEDIFRHVMKRDFHLPPFPLLYLQGLACRWIAGFGIREYSTLQAMETNRVPILFLHGGKDDFVPLWMTQKNYEACKAPKELLVIEEAEHAMSFPKSSERCWQVVKEFLQKYQ